MFVGVAYLRIGTGTTAPDLTDKQLMPIRGVGVFPIVGCWPLAAVLQVTQALLSARLRAKCYVSAKQRWSVDAGRAEQSGRRFAPARPHTELTI
jgi:hypothetical protein